MKKLDIKKSIYYLIVLIAIFSLDRISKLYVLNILGEKGQVDIYINEFINIFLIWNTGIGFGLLSFDDKIIYLIISIIIILINLILIYLVFNSDRLRSYSYLIILGGSFGNLFDRFYYSAVPDFIDLNYKGFHWFVFNVADIFISFGIICLIFMEIFKYKQPANEK